MTVEVTGSQSRRTLCWPLPTSKRRRAAPHWPTTTPRLEAHDAISRRAEGAICYDRARNVDAERGASMKTMRGWKIMMRNHT